MSKRKIIFYLIMALIAGIIIFCGYRFYRTLSDNKKIEKEINKIKYEVKINDKQNDGDIIIDDTSDDTYYILPFDFEKLKNINSDTVAWLQVANTHIDYPIVQTDNNSYYLNHSFYRQSNINGWIYENSLNSSSFDDENTVIFGHNTNGYTMFSELRDIYNGIYGTDIRITVYLENSLINYKVFSIYLENPNNTANISKYLNQAMLDEMSSKSKLKTDINVNEGDKILTLSTCNNVTNDRLILHAKKIS